MKLQMIQLADKTIKIEGDTPEIVKENVRKKPLYLTNRAIKKGYDTGILASSLYTSLLSVYNDKALHDIKNMTEVQKEAASVAILDKINMSEVYAVVYLAYIGANKDDDMDMDSFLDAIDVTDMELITIYFALLQSLLATSNKDAFVKKLKQNTATSKKKR